jgi:hypothetical protein
MSEDVRTGLITWAVELLKKNLPYAVILGFAVYIWWQEKERRQQTVEMLQAVREDRALWRTLAIDCCTIDSNRNEK